MKTNRMKAKLLAGTPALGASVMIPSPQLVEMMGHAGFDWVLIDCEHGTISLETVELMVMAAEASGITPIARPAQNTPGHILQLMDRGVMGVQVPHVNTAEDARRAVASVKYYPLGDRGLAVGTRSSEYGFAGSMAEYTAAANRETLVCVQLEDAEAIRNADEIIAVDGIDVFFIGPSDLSQSMGHPGNAKAPEVAAAINSTLAKIVAAKKTPGLPATHENVHKIIQQGARYIYTHVPKLLARSSDEFFKAAGR
ncbi:MAG TPA: aldolase/citrate lyase family protein [Opitutaceae bacterium]|nr:aldolase/citrate lyase family protein [Opitutaceae bacterium]